MTEEISLDIGCGLLKEGSVNVDLNLVVRPDVLCDMLFLPFRPNVFSLVNFNHSLEHTGLPLRALSEAFGVLTHGGTICIKFPNYWSLIELFFLVQHHRDVWQSTDKFMQHKFKPSVLQIIRLMRKAGFRIVFLEKDKKRGHFQRFIPLWLHRDVVCKGVKP